LREAGPAAVGIHRDQRVHVGITDFRELFLGAESAIEVTAHVLRRIVGGERFVERAPAKFRESRGIGVHRIP
jgi:hypothetical protein